MASQLLVAMDAGVKRVAALELNSDNVAVRMVVRTLSLLVNTGAVYHHLKVTRPVTAYGSALFSREQITDNQ
jgi:hypothetical protein